MADAVLLTAVPLLAVPLLALVAIGVAALRAVLAGRAAGIPGSIALLAPLAQAARAVRTRPALTPSAATERGCAVGLLAVAVLRTLLVPIDGRALIDPPGGIGALLVLDLVAWACWSRLAAARPRLRDVLAIEVAVAVALAGPVVAAGGRIGFSAVAAAQRVGPPFAVQMPGVLLVLLVAIALTPWSRPDPVPPRTHLVGLDRLLVEAARTASLVAGAAAAAALLLPGGPVLVLAGTALLAVVLVVAARRFPALRPAAAGRAALTVLLPLAALQLGVVIALAVLAGAI